MSHIPRMVGTVVPGSRHIALLAWLRSWQGPVLPRMGYIATLLPGRWTAYTTCNVMATLASRREIDLRHGTRSLHKGHYAIRIDGRVLKTEGCPFDPPDPPEGWKAGDLPGSNGRPSR